jgi:hypothetical protein
VLLRSLTTNTHSIIVHNSYGFQDFDNHEEAPEDQASLRLLPRKEDQVQWSRTVQQLRSNSFTMHLPANP